MNIFSFIRLIINNLKWLIIFPSTAAIVVIALTSELQRYYVSNTVVYTGAASGYDITTGESTGGNFNSIATTFDNLITTIKSRETIEEVSLNLLAQHLLLNEPQNNVLRADGYQALLELVPASLRDSLTVIGDFDATLENLKRYKSGSVQNEITTLLAGGSTYGINTILNNLGVRRVHSSDMIELSFTSTDPGITQHTLFFIASAFMDRYKGLKNEETSNVIQYFQDQLDDTYGELQNKEERLKQFGIDNRIINYQEQSKFIAESKEDLDRQLYVEKMKFEAAKASILKLENKLADHEASLAESQKLQGSRSDLIEVNKMLANARIYGEPTSVLDSLAKEKFSKEQNIRDFGIEYYKSQYSLEGVPIDNILNEWLTKVIEYEEARANLAVFDQRRKDFNEIYDHYAPLGSTLNQLEREVGITEQQYLSVLHGLNMARLRQQNQEMSNTLSILDQPFFPIKPLDSKRPLYVAGSFGGVLVFMLAFIFLKEFLDNTIQTPKRAEDLTNLTLGAALPGRLKSEESKIDYDFVESSLLEQAISSFSFELKKVDPYKRNYFIIVFSVLPNEGKSWFAEKYIQKLSDVTGETLYLFPQLDNNKPVPNFSSFSSKTTLIPYSLKHNFVETNNWEDLVSGILDDNAIDKFHYTILELPALSQHSFPSELVMKADLNVMVLNSNRLWGNADTHLSNLYLNATMNNTLIMLNNVNADNLESLLGEIPKKRSIVRKFAKRLLKFDFKNQSI